MQTLFERLSPENQALVMNSNDMSLITSLHANNSFYQLNVLDLVSLASIFKLNAYNISFTEAVFGVNNLFKIK